MKYDLFLIRFGYVIVWEEFIIEKILFILNLI